MILENELSNVVWLIANSKENDFEEFCKKNDLQVEHPVSLQLFKNKCQTMEVER